MARRRRGNAGRKGGIHVHDVVQAELVHDRPWPIKHATEDLAARVVAHLQGSLDKTDAPVERLGERWAIPQGIQTGADAYTKRIQLRLRRSFPDAKKKLDQAGAQTGAPIMELPAGSEKRQPWKDNTDLLARSIEPDAILYGAMDEARYTSLVWIGREDETPKEIVDELEPWKPVLANRADFRANPERRWWETHRTRDTAHLRKPKVIALYRTDRGRFALDEAGDWQPSIKTTLVIPNEAGLSVAYLCGLLNSELLDLWYGLRGKTPRDVWRNYEPKPMAEIPYRHLTGVVDPASNALEALDGALVQGDADAAAAVAESVATGLTEGAAGADTIAAAALERVVRAIAANRHQLLPFRPRFPGLERVVKDPWSTGPVDAGMPAFVDGLEKADVVSVRIDPALVATIDADGPLGRAQLEQGALVFVRSKKETARVTGSEQRLALLKEMVDRLQKPHQKDLLGVVLPKDLDQFEARVEADVQSVTSLLETGRVLAEAAERLVCRLYGVPRKLEDEVVAHAVTRAGSA